MSKQVYTVTKEGIEYVCSLINQIVTLPSDVIDDLNIATNTTYSSYKLNVDLNNLETNINDRTDKLIASLNKLSKKIITAESEIVDENTLYLLLIDSTNNVYQQWLLIDGSPVMVGTTEMSLDSVYTKDEADVKFGLKTVSDTLVTEVAGIKETIGTEDLTTIATTLKGAINELEAKHYLEVYDLQNTSVLDYAKTFDALTHNYFYANNCIDLPDNMNYGYCAVDVSQDPLYRDITFYCPTTGRIYVNTIGADPDDATVFGTWSGWHRHLNDDDIVTTLDDTVTDNQVPSAKNVYDEIKKGRIIFTDLPQGTDILAWADSLPDENFSQVYFCRANNCVNKPPNVTDGFIMVRRIANEKWIGLTWYDIRSTQTFECRKLNDVWGEWSVISPIKEGQVINSNGGGVNYFKQIKNMVVVTCSNTTRLIYTWNIGASINEGALPKPIIKIPVSIMSSNGEFYLAELDTDGYIKVKNRNIPATEDGNIYYYSFNYITDEL